LTDLIVQGGALPTFLLERIAAATAATAVLPQPPQQVCFREARQTAEFLAVIPLLQAEGLDWAFTD